MASQFSLTQGSSLQLQMIHQAETVHSDLTEPYFFDFSHLIQLSSLLGPNLYCTFVYFLPAYLKMKAKGKALFFTLSSPPAYTGDHLC